MKKAVIAACLLFAGGCASSQFHSVGTPDTVAEQASEHCAQAAWADFNHQRRYSPKDFAVMGGAAIVAFPLGALLGPLAGSAIEGAAMDPPPAKLVADRDVAYNTCMKSHGWVPNQPGLVVPTPASS